MLYISTKLSADSFTSSLDFPVHIHLWCYVSVQNCLLIALQVHWTSLSIFICDAMYQYKVVCWKLYKFIGLPCPYSLVMILQYIIVCWTLYKFIGLPCPYSLVMLCISTKLSADSFTSSLDFPVNIYLWCYVSVQSFLLKALPVHWTFLSILTCDAIYQYKFVCWKLYKFIGLPCPYSLVMLCISRNVCLCLLKASQLHCTSLSILTCDAIYQYKIVCWKLYKFIGLPCPYSLVMLCISTNHTCQSVQYLWSLDFKYICYV